MSFRDCITTAIGSGDLDGDIGRRAVDLFDELEARYRGDAGPFEAARQAAEQTVKAMRRESLENRRQTLLQLKATDRITKQMSEFRNAAGEEDQAAALVALLDRDDLANYSNVVARKSAVLGRLHGRMTEVLATFRRDIAGRVRNKAQLDNMVREVFGENTGDGAAKEMAKAWSEAADFARLRFNAAGGRVPKRGDWGMPQSHDSLAVRKVGFEEWRDFIGPKLNAEKMIDEATGLPIGPERLELALRDAYEAIRTDGFNKVIPSGGGGGRKLANRRTDHRFLVFKSADDWLDYQGRFGASNPFDAMVGHLDGMARDISLMEILGPNPSASLRFASEAVEKRAAHLDAAVGTTKHMDRARGKVKAASDMYAHLTGTANAPVNGSIGRSFAGLRMFLQSAQLGSAAISALTDINFQRIAAAQAGIPFTGQIKRFLGLLTPHVTDDQKLAVRLGLVAENWSTMALAQARYTGDVSGPEISRRLADVVMRASGLSPWTQAGRWAFGMEFMGLLADNAGRNFGELPKALQKTMTRYGLGNEAWNVLRSTDIYEHEGARFLRPDDLAGRTDISPRLADDLATRMLEMVQTETEFAVPSSSLRGRVAIVSDSRPGSLQGELLRSAAMYKNFSVTLMSTHIRRAMLEKGAMSKGRAFANLVISTTVMGGMAMQLKEIAKGRDPRPMNDKNAAAFWGAAMMQGGGLGIFGDFLFSNLNRMNRGLAETVAGPVVGFFNDVRRLTLGNVAQLPGEDPTNFGREITNFLHRYTPGGSMWYLRLGYERLILDELQSLIDPKAERHRRELQRRVRRQSGQRYFWRPGSPLPDRPPDLTNAVKG